MLLESSHPSCGSSGSCPVSANFRADPFVLFPVKPAITDSSEGSGNKHHGRVEPGTTVSSDPSLSLFLFFSPLYISGI